MSNKTKILQIITESTQTLDYTIPLLNYLNVDDAHNWEVTILYCSLAKERFTKGAVYFDEVDKRFGTTSFDLASFDVFYKSPLVKLFQWVVGTSISDSLSVRNYIKNIHLFGAGGLRYLFSGFKKKYEDYVIDKILNPEDLLNKLSPDIILFDIRAKFKNRASQKISRYIADSNLKVIVIPHAPHGRNAHDEFISIDNDCFPSNIEYWGCLNKSSPEWSYKSKELSSFNFVGFPPLDRGWNDYVTSARLLNKKSESDRLLHILYIPQKFQEKSNNKNIEIFDITTYEEELFTIKKVLEKLDHENIDYKLIIKPHPKISIHAVENLLRDLSHCSVESTSEPLYYHMEKVDFVISELSSAILYSACHVPILLIESKLNDYARKLWFVLDEIYNVGYKFEENSLKYVIKAVSDPLLYEQIVNVNRQYLNKYYGTNILEKALLKLRAIDEMSTSQ